MNKDLGCKKEIKCSNIVKQYKNVKLWLYYKRRHKKTIQIGHKFLIIHRILIVGGSGSGKTNALLVLINHEPDIDKTYSIAI